MIETLADLFSAHRGFASYEAVRHCTAYRGSSVSYDAISLRAAAIAAWLDRRSFRKGDRILLWGENCPEWIAVFWAAVSRGVELVPIDPSSSSSFASRISKESGSRLTLAGRSVDVSSLPGDKMSLADLNDLETPGRLEFAPLTPDDTVEVVYTSGTTGEPRGVIHRHRNICSDLRPIAREIKKYRRAVQLFRPFRILVLLPMSHMFGQAMALFIPPLLGGSVVFLNERSPAVVPEILRREGIHVLVAVPRIATQLKGLLERKFDCRAGTRSSGIAGIVERWWRFRRLHSFLGLRFWAIVVGAAQLPRETEAFFSKVGILVIQGYGLTEASPIVSLNHPLKARQGSLGKVLDGQQVRISAEGEILVRGDNVAAAYLAGSGQRQVTEDGWLRTGDLGELDAEGNLYFKGRLKDLIVTADGLNVYPQDVEDVLNSQEGIKESVVVGWPPGGGEKVHAVLLMRDGAGPPEDVIRRVNQLLEPHQRIVRWTVWPEADFPRTAATLKVQRREILRFLKEIVAGSTAAEPTPDSVSRILAEITGRTTTEFRDELLLTGDLGLSSLDRVELMARLEEEVGAELSEAGFASIESVGELRAWTAKHRAAGRIPPGEGSSPPSAGTPVTAAETPAGQEAPFDSSVEIRMPDWNRNWFFRKLRKVILSGFAIPLFRHYIELTVRGLDHLAGVSPPVIFAANHASHLDTLALLAALPSAFRERVSPAMLQEHFAAFLGPQKGRILARLNTAALYYLALGIFNAFPLPQRSGGVRRTLRHMGRVADEGYCPLVFPEGVRTSDGSLQPFRPGVAMMAAQLDLRVVPLYLAGLFEVMSLHDSWPRRGKVAVTFGAPVSLADFPTHEAAARFLEARVKSLASQ